MGFYVLLICSILTFHNISANIVIDPKDESYLEIIRKADEAEGINNRINADPFDVQCPPVTPPENGQIVGQVSLEIGAIVHIKCNEGYHLIGEDTIQCQAIPNPFDHKALWFHRVGDISSTSPPQCKRKVSVKPTVISESVKGAVKNVQQDLSNLAVHDVNDVTSPPPLFNQGPAKNLKDDHAYFPPEELKNQIEVKPDCVLPYVVGPCRASKPRFYFNVRSRKCERFIYGGCQGNGNNYMTKEECEVNCVKSSVNSSNV